MENQENETTPAKFDIALSEIKYVCAPCRDDAHNDACRHLILVWRNGIAWLLGLNTPRVHSLRLGECAEFPTIYLSVARILFECQFAQCEEFELAVDGVIATGAHTISAKVDAFVNFETDKAFRYLELPLELLTTSIPFNPKYFIEASPEGEGAYVHRCEGEKFATAFTPLYEQRWKSIVVALDPGLGRGEA